MVSWTCFGKGTNRLGGTLHLTTVDVVVIGVRNVAAKAQCLRLKSIDAKILLPEMVGGKCSAVAVISDTERTLSIYRASNTLLAVYV